MKKDENKKRKTIDIKKTIEKVDREIEMQKQKRESEKSAKAFHRIDNKDFAKLTVGEQIRYAEALEEEEKKNLSTEINEKLMKLSQEHHEK